MWVDELWDEGKIRESVGGYVVQGGECWWMRCG